jgi:hypothetical protein
MREGMLVLGSSMPAMEPDDQTLAQLAAYRSWHPPQPPPGLTPRAAQVADTALRVWWLAAVATGQAEREGRVAPDEVRRLLPLARRAAASAFSDAPQAPR